MAGKRRKFDAEFREGAVRTVAEAGKPIAQVAEDLGTNETTLASWVLRAHRAGGATATGESEELVRLRRASKITTLDPRIRGLLRLHVEPPLPADRVEATVDLLRVLADGLDLTAVENHDAWPPERQPAVLDEALAAYGL